MKPDDSKELATGPYPEAGESSPHPHIYFLKSIPILFSRLLPSLPSGWSIRIIGWSTSS